VFYPLLTSMFVYIAEFVMSVYIVMLQHGGKVNFY